MNVKTAIYDRSGTITTGGVSQILCAANPNRQGCSIYNPSLAESLYVNEISTATTTITSLEIPPEYERILEPAGTGIIYITGQTTGMSFNSREW